MQLMSVVNVALIAINGDNYPEVSRVGTKIAPTGVSRIDPYRADSAAPALSSGTAAFLTRERLINTLQLPGMILI